MAGQQADDAAFAGLPSYDAAAGARPGDGHGGSLDPSFASFPGDGEDDQQPTGRNTDSTNNATGTPSAAAHSTARDAATDIKSDDFTGQTTASHGSLDNATSTAQHRTKKPIGSPGSLSAEPSHTPNLATSLAGTFASASASLANTPTASASTTTATTATTTTTTNADPEPAASASASPSVAAGFFPQQNPNWFVYQNYPAAVFGTVNPAAIPSGFYNTQYHFAAQQWPASGVPAFTGELPERPRFDPQQPPLPPQPQPGLVSPELQQQQQELLLRFQQQQQLQQHPGFFPPHPAAAFFPQSHIRPNLPPEVLSSLTPAQQETLKSIAMPAHLQYHSPKSESSPQSSTGGGMPSSPDGTDPSKNNRKRKSSAEDDDDDDDDDDDMPQPIKKTAHNMIEKRYRTNLNEKIAALRDSVPSLRIMSKSARGEDTTEDREELHGLTPAHKLNKATVLSKATEYIRHLEKRNNRLLDENGQMQQRITAFEKLFMHGALSTVNPMSPMAQPSPVGMPFTAGQPDPSMAAFMGAPPMPAQRGPDPQGMIPVPEEMRRILQAQAATGRPYPVPPQPFQATPAVIRQQQLQQQQQMQQNRWQAASNYSKMAAVGSLAGLMILEAAREQEADPETTEGRGLFAAPLQLLRPLMAPEAHIGFGGYYYPTARLVFHLKFLILFGLLLWAFAPSLFAAPKARQQKAEQANAAPQAAPSLASPIHMRRQAWLTAIQNVWVPRHNFLLEAAALILKAMKLSIRNAFGIQGYQMLTGLTPEQETARVKAWSIALDAQLAGGDVEINERRLALTLLASHTLPDTPLRLMLNALHIRVLVRQLGKNAVLDAVAAHWARARWNAAREQNILAMQLPCAGRRGSAVSCASLQADDELPSHLSALLAEECDDVLCDEVVQRAYNLAFNHLTTFDVPADIVAMDGMNTVVEDPAVRSPLDAVGAWFSSLLVHRALAASLAAETDEAQSDVARAVASELDLAAQIAPIGSNAQVRALVARAVLVDEMRGASIATALQALRPSQSLDKHPQHSQSLPPLIGAPLAPATTQATAASGREAMMALRCAMAIAHLQRFVVDEPPEDVLASVDALVHTVCRSQNGEDGVSLLASAAAFRLMLALHAHHAAAAACALSLEKLAGSLRVWIGGPAGEHGGLDACVRHSMVRRCLAVARSVVGMDHDAGYGSLSEGEDEDADGGDKRIEA